jgi:hypothetical protein
MKVFHKIVFLFFLITILAFSFQCHKDKPSVPFDPACLSADKHVININDTVTFTNCSVYDSVTIEFFKKGHEFTGTSIMHYFDGDKTYKKVFADTGAYSAVEKAFIEAGQTNDTAMVYIYVNP